jgi:prepilin-type N-terminal cleavage/methylation domain-containing protein
MLNRVQGVEESRSQAKRLRHLQNFRKQKLEPLPAGRQARIPESFSSMSTFSRMNQNINPSRIIGHVFRNRKGFTLLELLIVMSIITLMLSISTVYISSALPSSRFNSTARDMAATIRHAKYLLQKSGKKQVVTIDIDSKRYGIEGRGDKEIPEGIDLKVIDTFSGEVNEGIYRLIFSFSGGPGGGTIVLWNKKREVKIVIDPVVGATIIK